MANEPANTMTAARRFAPGPALWIFTLLLLPVLIGLGFWQLDRADEKRLLQAQIDEYHNTPPVTLAQLDAEASIAWHPLQLTGQLDPVHIWLLDNRTRDGQAGVEVLQVFRDNETGAQLVVNRGWLPWRDRRQLPATPTPAGTLTLQAEALPEPAAGFTLAGETTAGWPKLIGAIDLPLFAQQADLPLLPWMARLQNGSAGAFRLDWPPLPMTASKHTGYAVQWFALAVALLMLFIWAGSRPESPGEVHHEHD